MARVVVFGEPVVAFGERGYFDCRDADDKLMTWNYEAMGADD